MRGEVLHHHSGLEFEIMESDPRRLRLVRIRGLSARTAEPGIAGSKTGG